MIADLTLHGKPVSTNSLYKYGSSGVYMTQDGKDFKESYGWEIRSQFKGQMIKDPVRIEMDLYFNNKRRRDWDNYAKIACDAMEGIVLKDDKQIMKATVEKKYDKLDPRIEIRVYEYNE